MRAIVGAEIRGVGRAPLRATLQKAPPRYNPLSRLDTSAPPRVYFGYDTVPAASRYHRRVRRVRWRYIPRLLVDRVGDSARWFERGGTRRPVGIPRQRVWWLLSSGHHCAHQRTWEPGATRDPNRASRFASIVRLLVSALRYSLGLRRKAIRSESPLGYCESLVFSLLLISSNRAFALSTVARRERAWSNGPCRVSIIICISLRCSVRISSS